MIKSGLILSMFWSLSLSGAEFDTRTAITSLDGFDAIVTARKVSQKTDIISVYLSIVNTTSKRTTISVSDIALVVFGPGGVPYSVALDRSRFGTYHLAPGNAIGWNLSFTPSRNTKPFALKVYLKGKDDPFDLNVPTIDLN